MKREIRVTSEAGLLTQSMTGTARGGPVLQGYAAVFNSLSEDLGGFREKILPGAFSDSLKNRDVMGLYSHDRSSILARTRNGSLLLRENSRGLFFELRLPNTQLGRDVEALVDRGDITQMSFGFSVPARGDDWVYERGQTIRTLRTVTLFEVSLVAEPAYSQTVVALRRVLDAVIAADLAARRHRLDGLLVHN